MFFSQPLAGLVPGPRGAVLEVLLRTGKPLTGRRLEALARGGYSHRSIQMALVELAEMGLVEREPVGRANVHRIISEHVLVPVLRALLDPIDMLQQVVTETVDDRVRAVILFGSIARGSSTASSDIDLAVVADAGWDGAAELQQTVATKFGLPCDVLTHTQTSFIAAWNDREPVITDIMRDGVTLIGSKPVGGGTDDTTTSWPGGSLPHQG